MHKYALTLLASAALAGCGTIRESVLDPHLSPVTAPTRQITPVSLPVAPAPAERYAPNSLWRAGARTFFNDQRASRVGDILTVKILIDDNAQLSNNTQRSRKSSTDLGIPNLLGYESKIGKLLPFPKGTVDPSNLINATGDTSTQGQGAVTRAEKVVLTVAAVITQILPNGNLVIDGSQQVLINNEMRNLTVAGFIRPEDISSDNTILHTQIAEARISYGGQGVLSTVQKPGFGQRVADALTPW